MAPSLDTWQKACPGEGQLIEQYLHDHPWAQHVASAMDTVRQQMQQYLEPLHVQPTKDAPSGVFFARSLDGTSGEIKMETRSGSSLVLHEFLSTGALRASQILGSDVLQMKLGAQPATMKQGTPFLEITLAGNETNGLTWLMTLVPRLNSMVHAHYMTKYYRHTPASYAALITTKQGKPPKLPVPTCVPELPGREGKPLQTFEQLYRRLYMAYKEIAAAIKPGAEPGQPLPLLRPVHLSEIWPRILDAHACSFYMDPKDENAMQATIEFLQEFVALWCAWVAADATAPELSEPLLSECRVQSSLMAHHNHPEHTDSTERGIKVMGAHNMKVFSDSMSGENAHSPEKLWWPGATNDDD